MVSGVWPGVLAAAALLIVALVGVVWVLRRRYVVVTVRGPSMEPTLRAGERVLVRRCTLSRLRAGDLVVFANAPLGPDQRPPGDRPPHDRPPYASGVPAAADDRWLIKRAVAVPGDPVPRDAGGQLSYLDDAVVPPHSLIVLGDNAAVSHDSRHFGYVTADRLLGTVLRKL